MSLRDTLAEVFALTPKPRGEGAWAWVRYHLIRAHAISQDEPAKCRVRGCPYPVRGLRTRCQLHLSDSEREACARVSAERKRRIELGEWDPPSRRTWRQKLGMYKQR